MSIVASETYTSTSAPIQYAAVEAYKENELTELYLKNSRMILKAVGMYMYNNLKNIGVTMPKPEGGFYLFPNFNKWKSKLNKRGIYTDKDFCNTLLEETGIALLPGEAFGLQEAHITARLSYVDFNGQELLQLLEKFPKSKVDGSFVEQNCPRIVMATEKMKAWLASL